MQGLLRRAVKKQTSHHIASHLDEMYRQRMVDIWMPPEVQVNHTRFEERLILNCPHLTATKHGREIFLIVDCNIGQSCNMDSDIICSAKAGNVIRARKRLHLQRKIRSLGTDKISAQRVDVFREYRYAT